MASHRRKDSCAASIRRGEREEDGGGGGGGGDDDGDDDTPAAAAAAEEEEEEEEEEAASIAATLGGSCAGGLMRVVRLSQNAAPDCFWASASVGGGREPLGKARLQHWPTAPGKRSRRAAATSQACSEMLPRNERLEGTGLRPLSAVQPFAGGSAEEEVAM